jgi:ribosome biogenesis protein Tsr3
MKKSERKRIVKFFIDHIRSCTQKNTFKKEVREGVLKALSKADPGDDIKLTYKVEAVISVDDLFEVLKISGKQIWRS